MQNWNQWQLPTGAVTTPMPQPPFGYVAPGADPMAMMQSYMQYYNQPAPSGYTAEQWAAAQQQCWAQWQQWQQQYQQWQAQYGEKYQETMKQMSAQNLTGHVPFTQNAPPLPKEDAKPPLPPNTYQFTSLPPPHQNNLPLFPAKQPAASSSAQQAVTTNYPQNPPPPPSCQPPLPPESCHSKGSNSPAKRAGNTVSESVSAKKLKVEDEEELTEAEKTFDAQFKQWEEQFNKWKQQNANHPDKTQYKQYEAKWTSWREKLIERREQMRKKREQQKQQAASKQAETEKSKSNLPGDDKILNILSNTENQGLINNLLGIGKTLGLTGKQSTSVPPLPPPPQTPQASIAQASVATLTTQTAMHQATPQVTGANMLAPTITSSSWNIQQWPQKFNAGMNMSSFPSFQSIPPPPPFGMPPPQVPPPDFSQPPPSLPNSVPNFSQPPPRFNNSEPMQNPNIRPPVPGNIQERPFVPEMNRSDTRPDQNPNFEAVRSPNNFGPNQKRPEYGDHDRYNKNPSDQEGNQFRSNDSFGFRNDGYKYGNEGPPDQYKRDDRNYPENSQGNPGDRFGSGNDRFGPGNDRFVSGNDRFGPGTNRFGPGPGTDRFGPGVNRFGPGNDRFGPSTDRFGMPNEKFGHDRFGRNNDRFEQKDGNDRRDSFGGNSRNFNRNNQFEPPSELAPELKKLMEKRKAAINVFKPSFPEPDKTSLGSSLSESFRKITGDSPFTPRSSTDFGQRDYSANKGNSGLSLRGPVNNVRMSEPDHRSRESNEFKLFINPEFGPRGPPGFNPRCNVPDSRTDIRETAEASNFGKQAAHGPADTDERTGKPFEFEPNTIPQHIHEVSGEPKSGMEYPGDNAKSAVKDNFTGKKEISENPNESCSKGVTDINRKQEADLQKDRGSDQGEIPTLERSSWIDTHYPEGNPLEKSKKDSEETQVVNAEEQLSSLNNANDMKKSDTLPFMGENDPKPEDLNMEPPPELPNLGLVPTERSTNEPPFRGKTMDEPADIKGSTSGQFELAGPFGPRNNFESPFGARGPFRPNGPVFSPRGPNDGRFPFGPRDPPNFPFRSPMPDNRQMPGINDPPFGRRGLSDGQFGSRGLNENQFGPRGPPNRQFDAPFKPSDSSFDNRGPNDMSFGLRAPMDGPLGPSNRFSGPGRQNDAPLGGRGPNENFGPRNYFDSQFRGPRDEPFGPRGFNDKPFAPPGPGFGLNDRPFGPRGLFTGPNDGPRFGDGPFNSNRPPFGPRDPGNNVRQRGQFNNTFGSKEESSKPNIPSLLSFRFDPPRQDGTGYTNLPDGQENSRDSGRSSLDSNEKRLGHAPDCFGEGRRDWRQPTNTSNDPNTENGQCGQKEEVNPNTAGTEKRSSFGSNRQIDSLKPEKHGISEPNISPKREFRSGSSELAPIFDFGKFGGLGSANRSTTEDRQLRGSKEFCIERQFNYNHGSANTEKFMEHVPAKVIDYAHMSRSNHDYLLPAQCFDYGHGSLKPVIPEHEPPPQRDFRHWEENEQNLKEYTEKLKKYENTVMRKDYKRSEYSNQRRDTEWDMNDRKSEYDRRERSNYRDRDREYEEKSYDRTEKDQDSKYENDRSNNKDRTQERYENSRKDIKKDNEKDDDRSKGNISWQENSNKNIIETKAQDSSISDTQQNVEVPPKTLELSKTPNCTMVDDLLCPPGRQNRPPKIAIILRGPPGSGKSFVAKLIKDKEVEQGGSAPRILSLDDYFLVEKERETKDDNGKKIVTKEMVYEYEEGMESSYTASLVKAFKKNITDGYFNFIILDCINEKISDYEEMWSFAKTKGFKVYVCEMEMDLQICLKRNIHNRTEEEINRIIDYFEPTPSYHQKLDVNSMLQEQAIEEVHMEDSEETQENPQQENDDSQDSQDGQDTIGVSKWERMEAEDKLDRLDGLAKKKSEKPQTMEDFLQVPDYYNMEDTSGKKRVRWADLEERKEQEKMRAVGFVVGHTNWDRMMDPTKGGSALTRTKYI